MASSADRWIARAVMLRGRAADFHHAVTTPLGVVTTPREDVADAIRDTFADMGETVPMSA